MPFWGVTTGGSSTPPPSLYVELRIVSRRPKDANLHITQNDQKYISCTQTDSIKCLFQVILFFTKPHWKDTMRSPKLF